LFVRAPCRFLLLIFDGPEESPIPATGNTSAEHGAGQSSNRSVKEDECQAGEHKVFAGAFCSA